MLSALDARMPAMSALETNDINRCKKASGGSPAWGFRASGGKWDTEGRGDLTVGDEEPFPVPLEENKLTESRCKKGGLVAERGRGRVFDELPLGD